MNFAFSNLQIIFPEIFLSSFSLITLLIGSLLKKSKNLINFLIILGFITTIILLSSQDNCSVKIIFNGLFSLNNFDILIKILLLITSASILCLYKNTDIYREFHFEFPLLISFSTLGMMIMLSANDFIPLYLGFELQSLCLYALAAYNKNNDNSSEAGLKYFILGALSSGILLFGISLIYGFSGSTNFSIIKSHYVTFSNNVNLPIGILIGLIMVIIGFAFKVSAAPFHMWAPDVYQGSPTIVTAFFSTAPKIASVIFLLKLLTYVFNGDWINQWNQIIIFLSILSLIIGAIGALNQVSIKRILAYSSIGHVGFILMGMATGNKAGIEAISVYVIVYTIMNLGIFSLLLMIKNKDPKLQDDININDLNGFSGKYSLTAFGLSLLLLSMAGIPPLAGFFIKFSILKAAIEQKMYILAIIGILMSIISTYYYLRIIKIMYFDKTEIDVKSELIPYRANIIIFTIASLFNLFFICFSDRIYEIITKAVHSLQI